MFSFLKSKPILKDLIPDNHVDIHSHLLPGIDDGSKNIKETEMLFSRMLDMGIKKIITTPHVMNTIYPNNRDKINDVLKITRKEFTEKSITFDIKAAAEYFMDDSLLLQLKTEKLLTLKDNYLLVEMSYMNPPINLYDIIFELQIAGYKPVLAHPERYFYYHKSIDEYNKLKKYGCLFQLNLLSTVGYYGSDVAKATELLLKKGMIDFVGSDIHHLNHIAAFSEKIIINDIVSINEVVSNNQLFNF